MAKKGAPLRERSILSVLRGSHAIAFNAQIRTKHARPDALSQGLRRALSSVFRVASVARALLCRKALRSYLFSLDDVQFCFLSKRASRSDAISKKLIRQCWRMRCSKLPVHIYTSICTKALLIHREIEREQLLSLTLSIDVFYSFLGYSFGEGVGAKRYEGSLGEDPSKKSTSSSEQKRGKDA